VAWLAASRGRSCSHRATRRHARIHASGQEFAADTQNAGSFRTRYAGVGPAARAEPGTLEYFLTERYCLYGGEGDVRAEIHHAPWPLQSAEADVEQRVVAPVRLEGEPICHFAQPQDVVIWSPERY
jgi:uncharacterized protein YqjF (DUF2071 family)